MSDTKFEGEKEQVLDNDDTKFEDGKEHISNHDDAPKSTVYLDADGQFLEDGNDSEKKDPLPCTEEQEEQTIKKRYGGLTPKRLPLISKDQDHAFFDSADWALGKQGAQKSKGSLEALRPKLQPSPHQQIRSRRSAYAHAADDGEGHESSNDNCSPSEEDHGFSDDNFHPHNQSREN